MSNQSKFFIGIDVSKPYFDASLLVVNNYDKSAIVTERFINTKDGIKFFDKWLAEKEAINIFY